MGVASDRRYIPTRVGTTSIRSATLPNHAGTSPRVWGPRLRSIAASNAASVHPHACGDHHSRHRRLMRDTGTSPRVWGPRLAHEPIGKVRRYIPTRVGTTGRVLDSGVGLAVHPHACGDHALLYRVPLRVVRYIPTRVGTTERCPFNRHVIPGTSPRVWGPRRRAPTVLMLPRYIPTRVGTTLPIRSRRGLGVGTSPRVWGPRLCLYQRIGGVRYIPTRAGTTAEA